MSDAELLSAYRRRFGPVILGALEAEPLSTHGLQRLVGRKISIVRELLGILQAEGHVEQTDPAERIPRWRIRARVPVLVRTPAAVRRTSFVNVQETARDAFEPAGGTPVSEYGDERLVRAVFALGGLPIAHELRDGRIVYLNMLGGPWVEGQPPRGLS